MSQLAGGSPSENGSPRMFPQREVVIAVVVALLCGLVAGFGAGRATGGGADSAATEDLDDVETSTTSPSTTDPEPEPDDQVDEDPPTTASTTSSSTIPLSEMTLRQLADERGIVFGAAMSVTGFDDPRFVEAIDREFNQVVFEGACLIVKTHDLETPYDLNIDGDDRLGEIDLIADMATDNGQTLGCAHLVWYLESSWATFLADFSPEESQEFIERRMRDLMTRYDGRIDTWYVVNEAFNNDGEVRPASEVFFDSDSQPVPFNNWLAPLGEQYIEDAFRLADQIDPDGALFYNDYAVEFGGAKWDAILSMTRDFVDRGVPIDGIGIQTHLSLRNLEGLEENMTARFAEVAAIDPSLEVRVTELDVLIDGGPTTEQLDQQAEMYGIVMRTCLAAPNCTGVTLWGLTDGRTWRPGRSPLIFDLDYNPKPAHEALRQALIEG